MEAFSVFTYRDYLKFFLCLHILPADTQVFTFRPPHWHSFEIKCLLTEVLQVEFVARVQAMQHKCGSLALILHKGSSFDSHSLGNIHTCFNWFHLVIDWKTPLSRFPFTLHLFPHLFSLCLAHLTHPPSFPGRGEPVNPGSRLPCHRRLAHPSSHRPSSHTTWSEVCVCVLRSSMESLYLTSYLLSELNCGFVFFCTTNHASVHLLVSNNIRITFFVLFFCSLQY